MSFSSIEPPRRSVLMVDADTIDPASYYPSPGPEDHQTPPHIAASGDSDEELAAETSQMNLIDDLEDEEDEEEDEDGEGAEVEIGERVGGGEDGAEEDNWETRRTALPLPPEHLFKNNPSQPLLLKDFRVIKTLGTGTFGRVLLVCISPDSPHHHPNALQHFAMKVLRKTEVSRLKQVAHVIAERQILARIRHPFIVDLYATFQDYLNVYMLLSYIPGGELFSHLRRAGRFTPDVTRFYLGGIVLALRYLHSFNVIYRDLKPENLLLDHRGYLRVADFGFAKLVDDRTWTLCGTPEYLAPEIINQIGHSKAVDWWACGILAYEMMVGYPPFFDENPFGIYDKILKGKIYWPKELDLGSKEFVKGFLTQDRTKRLGNLKGGAEDILNHPWFNGVDWVALERQQLRAPLIPQVTSASDTRNFTNLDLPSPSEIPGLVPEAALPAELQEDPEKALFADF